MFLCIEKIKYWRSPNLIQKFCLFVQSDSKRTRFFFVIINLVCYISYLRNTKAGYTGRELHLPFSPLILSMSQLSKDRSLGTPGQQIREAIGQRNKSAEKN